MALPLARRRARRSRGVALLLVLIVLLLVATLAVEIQVTARTHHQLAQHAMNDFLLRSVVDGRRHILLAALRYDQSLNDNVDTEKDPWSWSRSSTLSSWGEAAGTVSEPFDAEREATTAKAYRNRDVKIVAWCEDERSKLNLRGLLWEHDNATYIATRRALERLIDVYREKWAELDLSDSEASSMVDDLVDFLDDREDSEENPLPPTHARQGRLLSLEELLRVPGGKWRPELLYDVRDPRETDEEDWSRRIAGPAEESADDAAADDTTYVRANGVPGLFRYLTVWGEGTAGSVPRINVNTAPLAVLESLFESGQGDLAEAIVEHRRQGADPVAGTGSSGASGDAGSSSTGGWFKQKTDLTKVEGMGDDLGRYPRLDTLAETKSSVFSLRILASVVAEQREADAEAELAARDIEASYQYREVVQRTQQGFVSMHAERRSDPLLGTSDR